MLDETNQETMPDEQMMEKNTQAEKYLSFSLDDQEYGIDIRNVTEIIGIQSITEIPDTPPFVKGVINLRGKVIPVIDVRLRFDLEEQVYNERTCVIVVHLETLAVGLVVDTVSEVIDIPKENIEASPEVKSSSASRYIEGLGKVGEEVKILLNTNKLIFSEEAERLADVIGL